jgi:hypothetical protein
VNLGCNALDDGAMDALMGYAKKDVCLRKVLVQANDIEVGPGSDWITLRPGVAGAIVVVPVRDGRSSLIHAAC